MTTFPWLSVLWAVPMVGAGAVMAVPAARRALAKWFALAVAVGVLVLTAVIAVLFDPSGPQYQFVENRRWIPSFGTGYILGVDGIALALVVLTAVLVPLLIVAGWNDARGDGRSVHTYLALTLAVEGMVFMSLVALDVLLFYVFFEAMLIPMYFLIGGFGGQNRSAAAVKFLLYNLFGGLIMLAAVIGLYVATAGSEAFGDSSAAGTFDFRAIVAAVSSGDFVVDPAVLNLLFLGFMFAFAVKAPLWPFHRWLPDAAVEATPASAVLMDAAVLPAIFPGRLDAIPPGDHHARSDRHRVRRDPGGRTDRRHAIDRLHLDIALRVHHPGHLRDDQPGSVRFHAVHGQSRDLHRGTVPDRGIPGVAAGIDLSVSSSRELGRRYWPARSWCPAWPPCRCPVWPRSSASSWCSSGHSRDIRCSP